MCRSNPHSSRLNFAYSILTALNNIAFVSGELSNKNDVSPVFVSGGQPRLPQSISFLLAGSKRCLRQTSVQFLLYPHPQAWWSECPSTSSSLLSIASTSQCLRDQCVTFPSSSMAVYLISLPCLAAPPARKAQERVVPIGTLLPLPPCSLVIRVVSVCLVWVYSVIHSGVQLQASVISSVLTLVLLPCTFHLLLSWLKSFLKKKRGGGINSVCVHSVFLLPKYLSHSSVDVNVSVTFSFLFFLSMAPPPLAANAAIEGNLPVARCLSPSSAAQSFAWLPQVLFALPVRASNHIGTCLCVHHSLPFFLKQGFAFQSETEIFFHSRIWFWVCMQIPSLLRGSSALL